MKFIILLSVLIIISCSLCSMEQSVTIKLKPSDVGYDVYGEGGELLLEFTELNCSKEELELLEKIHTASLKQSANLKLKPTGEGYTISGEDGELLMEFTEESLNEKELDLLKYIYEVSLEFKQELWHELIK